MGSEGFELDPSKSSKLSMEEKREFVYELSDSPQCAPELLHSWSRNDILQILTIETGKERKFTGLTKLKIIEILLKVVTDKKSPEKTTKRQRKSETSTNTSSLNNVDCSLASNDVKICKNLACRAILSQEDGFCKRCSCCICHRFDDNKDPSLWLTCSSEYPYEAMSCGLSCHLECALQHERSGIPKDGHSRGLDGCFYCVSCGKVNDLLQCWRKQMTTARDTRSVNILCFRVSLSQKLLSGTVRYENLHKIVNESIQKLKSDVGPLTDLPVKQARGIVNRLASGQEVQRLCALAVKSLDTLLSKTNKPLAKDDEEVKISQSQSLVTNSSSLSNPSSVEDENNNIVGCKDTKDRKTDTCNEQEKTAPDDVNNNVKNVKEFDSFVHITDGDLPVSPCKTKQMRPEPSKDNLDDGSGKEQDGSCSKKRNGEDRDFGYYVKVIRWLERKQHIDADFRQKFLTWYSLRASPRDVRVVKVFVDTLMEDPALLAGQLVDAFSEVVTSKQCSKGLCLKLFH
ncbi:putative oberon, PHD finger domain, vernalization insensitive 3 [Helianthus annuus]|nr:putative oberon, PHD finger domain, vernalization insensitive 3 [Helianthus annuus]